MTTTWQTAQADAIELEADTIEGALIQLRRLEGMFDTRVNQNMILSTVDMLSVEAVNRRKKADKIRERSQ